MIYLISEFSEAKFNGKFSESINDTYLLDKSYSFVEMLNRIRHFGICEKTGGEQRKKRYR